VAIERTNRRAETADDFALTLTLAAAIAAQLATVAMGEPGRASSIERFSEGVRGRNHL
jgi:hypothetical protein